jgi:hypothetical protein
MEPLQPALAHHVALYRYWQSKRQGRAMPARRDLDPAEVPGLLPHLTLIEVVGERFRYRLVGSRVVQDFGRELTGTFVGSHVNPPEYARAICSIYERVCATRQPVFTTGEYRSPSQLSHTVSRLLVPLGDDGETVNMILLTRVSRYDRGSTVTDWLGRAAGEVSATCEVGSEAAVHDLSLAWERQSTTPVRIPA